MKKNKVKIKKDDIVKLSFLDHTSNINEPLLCICYGRVEKITKVYINISTWDIITCDESIKKTNEETYSILRSTIVAVEIL